MKINLEEFRTPFTDVSSKPLQRWW